MRKKILALVLAFLMVVGMLPTNVYTSRAEETTENTENAESTDTNVWDTAGEASDVCLIGFLDKSQENIVFYNNLEAQNAVASNTCPDYLILTKSYPHVESGEAVLYQADSADDNFYFGTLSKNPFIEAKYFSAVVEAKGLYATLTDNAEVILYKELTDSSDFWTASAGELSGEYVVADFCYDSSSLYSWCMKLTPDDTWPDGKEEYVWLKCSDVASLSQTPTQESEEEQKCDICGAIDCTSKHENWCEICQKDECGIVHDAEVPTIYDTVVDSEGNVQTVTVSGEALPEGARLEVTPVENEAEILAAVDMDGGFLWDIKVYDQHGNSWQPNSVVSITMTTSDSAVQYAEIYHFLNKSEAVKNALNSNGVGYTYYLDFNYLEEGAYGSLNEEIVAYQNGTGTEDYGVVLSCQFNVEVVDYAFTFLTDSFSIFSVRTYNEKNDTYGLDEDHRIELQTKNGSTYYVTADQDVYVDNQWLSSDIDNWTVTGNADDAVKADTNGRVKVHVYKNASEGDSITINYTTGGFLGIGKQSHTIYLVVVKEYKLTYNANGGIVTANTGVDYGTSTGSSVTQDVITGETVSLPIPTRTGYHFDGWSCSNGSTYCIDGAAQSYSVPIGGSNLTFTAQWSANNYTVTYNANGGSVSPATKTVTYDSAYGELAVPTRTNYRFLGWYTAASGGTQVTADTVYKTAGNSTLYAHWEWDVQISNGYDGYLYPAGVKTSSYKWYKQSGTYSYDTTTWSNSWSEVSSSSLSGNNVDVLKDGGYVKENADMVSGTKYQYRLDGLDSNGKVIGSAYYTVNFSDHILNSSFESPKGADGACKGYAYNHENIFWSSTVTGELNSGRPWDIEIIGSGNASFGSKVAYHERQFAEINANAASALYQDVLTESDTYLGWALSHTCRLTSGTDTMYVMIASSKTARYVQTQDELDILIDNAKTVYENADDDRAKAAVFTGETELTATVDGVSVVYRIWEISSEFNSTTEWTLHSGNYYVPEGQTMTRFFFAAGLTASTAQGTPTGDTIGNLIDTVAFDDKIYYTVNYYLDGKLLTGYGETGIGNEGDTITANETTISAITADNAAVLQSVYLNNTSQGTSNKSMVLEKERANNLSLYFSSNHTLTFDYNGGKSSSDNRVNSSHTVTYGSSDYYEVKWLNPAREGYTFDGWYTAKTGGTQMYGTNGLCIAGAYWNSINQWIGSSGMTVYAHWIPYNYSVVFNGNGHTSGSMSNQSFVYDAAQALNENKFVRQYTVSYVTNGGNVTTTIANTTATATFNGWATSANGDKVYNNKQSVSNLTATQNGIYNIFAHWTLNSVTLPTPQHRAGYNFLGWYEDANFEKSVGAAGVEYTPQSNVTLYAKWEQINYTITFKNDNGDVISTKTDYHYGDTITVPNDLQKQATAQYTYKFAGWTPEVTSVTGDATYTAQFEATEKECTITYVAGTGGKVSLEAETFKVGSGIPSGSTATADTGYKFVGWYDQNNNLVGYEAEFKPAKQSNNLYTTATYTAKFELALVDLKITAKGEDANQSYIFTITGTSDDGSSEISLKIVLVGNASKTIKDLPVGTYTIEETANDSKWSWRQDDVSSQAVELKSYQEVTFDFGKIEKKQWLNGYHYNFWKGGSN